MPLVGGVFKEIVSLEAETLNICRPCRHSNGALESYV